MNQINKVKFDIEENYPTISTALTEEEIHKLRNLLSFVSIFSNGNRLEIGNDDAKLVISQNGKLRLKGRSITQVAQGEYRINAAVIELN